MKLLHGSVAGNYDDALTQLSRRRVSSLVYAFVYVHMLASWCSQRDEIRQFRIKLIMKGEMDVFLMEPNKESGKWVYPSRFSTTVRSAAAKIPNGFFVEITRHNAQRRNFSIKGAG